MYDLMGKYLDVPAYKLLGPKVRNHGKVGYFVHDLDPHGLAEEVRHSLRMGYLLIKIKGRPWFDPVAQVAAISEVSPPDYTIEIDLDRHLRSVQKALPVLRRLEGFPKLIRIEQPILGFDLRGLSQLRRLVDFPILLHWLSPTGCSPRGRQSGMEAVLSRAADGFVLRSTIGEMLNVGAICELFNLPCSIEAVGCGFQAAFALHLMAVLASADLPATINQNLRVSDLLVESIQVQNGVALIPEGPGLGESLVDGFVLSGTIGQMIKVGCLLQQLNLPCFLQLVGMGPKTAFTLHLASVIPTATLPAITLHLIFESTLVKESFSVAAGFVNVPTAPGLGVSLDETEILRHSRVFPQNERRQIFAVCFADGRRHFYAADERDLERRFLRGEDQGYLPGMRLEVLDDDGSGAFDRLYPRVQDEPIWE